MELPQAHPAMWEVRRVLSHLGASEQVIDGLALTNLDVEGYEELESDYLSPICVRLACDIMGITGPGREYQWRPIAKPVGDWQTFSEGEGEYL